MEVVPGNAMVSLKGRFLEGHPGMVTAGVLYHMGSWPQ